MPINLRNPHTVPDSRITRRTKDAHHNIEFGWVEDIQQLYQRAMFGDRVWRAVHRIHITPHRIEILHCLINNT